MIAPPPLIFADPWVAPVLEEPDFRPLFSVIAADYQKWLRRQARTFGRKAMIARPQQSLPEAFVEATTGFRCNLLAGGEIEVFVGGQCYTFFSGWNGIPYYTYNDDDVFVRTLGEALKFAEWEWSEHLFIAQD